MTINLRAKHHRSAVRRKLVANASDGLISPRHSLRRPDGWPMRARFAWIALIGVWCALSLGCSATTSPVLPEGRSHYLEDPLEKRSDNSSVIVFVHGVLGNAKDTWTNRQTGAYFPELVLKDPEFDGFNVYVFEYKTPLLGQATSIDELAATMRTILDTDRIFEHREVIFVCHSMGGLVVRSLLMANRDLVPKVKALIFFATPTGGSELGKVAKFFSRNPQYGQMVPLRKNEYQKGQVLTWQQANLPLMSFCAYESESIKGIIPVVPFDSAIILCNATVTPVGADHVGVVKPAKREDVPYRVLQRAFRMSRSRQNFRPQILVREAIPLFLQGEVGESVDVGFSGCDEWLDRRMGEGWITSIHSRRAQLQIPAEVGGTNIRVDLHIERKLGGKYEVLCRVPDY